MEGEEIKTCYPREQPKMSVLYDEREGRRGSERSDSCRRASVGTKDIPAIREVDSAARSDTPIIAVDGKAWVDTSGAEGEGALHSAAVTFNQRIVPATCQQQHVKALVKNRRKNMLTNHLTDPI